MQGIYRIRHKTSGKVYVGSSKDIEKRGYWHLTALQGNYHQNCHLQRAWNKYGEKQFAFEVVEEVQDSQENLLGREQFWLSHYCRLGKAYNIATNAYGGDLGEEWRWLLSIAKGGTGEPREEKYCVGCGIRISFYAARCLRCAGRLRRVSEYIGDEKPMNHCIDCGKEICDVSTRCQSCATRFVWVDSRARVTSP